MSRPPADLTSETGALVFSIEVLRRSRWEKEQAKACQHRRVSADLEVLDLTCRDCGARVNPVHWITEMADSWREVEESRAASRRERERLEQRRRVKCYHCGESVTLRASREDEKRWRETRTGRYETALETIAVLVPGAAAQHAANIAKVALAARPRDETPPPPLAAVDATPETRGDDERNDP